MRHITAHEMPLKKLYMTVHQLVSKPRCVRAFIAWRGQVI